MSDTNQNLTPAERQARIEALVRQLGETEDALQALLGDEVDAVVDPVRGTPIILRRAQAALRQSETRTRLLLEHVPAVVWTTDGDLYVTSIAGRDLDALGMMAEEVIGRGLADVIDAGEHDGLTGVLSAHHRALAGQRASYDARVGERVFHGTVEPLRDESGRIVGCAGLGLDVTRRRRIEGVFTGKLGAIRRRLEALAARDDALPAEHRALVEEVLESSFVAVEELQVTAEELTQQNEELAAMQNDLAASQRRYRDLFEAAPDGYLVTDPAGVIRQANRAAADLLGAREEDLRDKPLVLYVAAGDRAAFHRRLDRVLTAKEPDDVEWEVRVRPREGAVFPAALTVSPIHDRAGALSGLRWLLRDISASRRAEERERLLEETRVAAEDAQAANTLLRTLLESMPVGVIVCDADGTILMNNERGQAILGERVGGEVERPRRGYEPYRPDGTPFPADDMPLVHALERGETVRDVEILIRRADGEERTILAGATPVRGKDGAVVSGVTVFQDITRRKLAEEALRRSERRYHSLYTAMSEGLVLHEMVYDDVGEPVDYVVVDANPAFETLTGLAVRDVVGGDASDVYGTEEPPYLETCARVVDTGEPVSFETYFPSMDKYFSISVFSPDPGRFATIFTDVTARKAAEAERERLLARVRAERERIRQLAQDLMRERNVMETIMAHTDAHLAYLDADFNFVRVNTAYARGSGYSREELVGRNHFDLFPHAENQAVFEQVRETGEAVTFWAKPFEFADNPDLGVTYWDWTLAPVHDARGRIDGFVFSLVDVTEREQLIAQLGQERALLEAVVKHAPEAIVVADREGRIVRANPAAERIYARPVPYGEDVESHGDLALCHPDGTPYAPRNLPLTRSALNGEAFHNLEMAVVWPDGQRRELLVATAPIEDERGQGLGAVGVFQDVTAIKRVQEKLRRYAERLHGLHETDRAILAARSLEEVVHSGLYYLPRLLDCVHIGITMYDLARGWVTRLAGRANGEIDLEKARYGADDPVWALIIEAIGRGRTYVVEDVDDLPASSGFVEELHEGGVRALTVIPLMIEEQLIGSLNVGLAQPGTLADEEMEVVNELAVQLAIGIHQARLRERVQQHAENLERQVARRTAELRASEARFRAIFESAGVGIARLDRYGYFDDCNPALQEMLGYEAGALHGQHFLALAYVDEEGADTKAPEVEGIDADEAQFAALMRGERERCVIERRYAHGDGRTIWARWTVSPVRPPQGQRSDGAQSVDLRFAIGMMEDVTGRKEAQEALIQAEKLSLAGRLAASFAHEINNPLQSVIGCLGLARESLNAEVSADSSGLADAMSSVDNFLQIALEELRRASGIVGQLRDLHRKSEPGERTSSDVNELLEQIILVSKNRCAQKGVDVTWEPGADLPKPNLAGDRIKQVFLNLLINAVDAMPDGGELRIATRYDARTGGVQVTFADSGLGIPEHIRPHLFEPFYTTKDEGMGMGLFVSQSIVENHGGHMDVETEVGEGTTFTIWLPLA